MHVLGWDDAHDGARPHPGAEHLVGAGDPVGSSADDGGGDALVHRTDQQVDLAAAVDLDAVAPAELDRTDGDAADPAAAADDHGDAHRAPGQRRHVPGEPAALRRGAGRGVAGT